MIWNTYTLTLSDLAIDINEIYLNAGYGDTTPDEQISGMIKQLLDEISGFCRPTIGYTITEGKIPDNKLLIINNVPIRVGQVITKYLCGCNYFASFVVSAGIEFDKYINRFKANGDIVSEFLAYSIGTEIAEAAVRYVSGKIAEDAAAMNMGYTHSYSPGYCSWHVREQENLFKILPEKPCGINLNESNLMFPEKSVSGIIGLGAGVIPTSNSCDICGLKSCYKRKKSAKT